MATDERVDEETPLLQSRTKTPVPWGQVNVVLFVLVTEPVSSAYIFPFINQLIGELGITGGDDRKIGYYAGLIESLFFVAQAATVLQWSRLSDFIGRKPVIMIGLLGLSISNFAFGLSRTFGTLVISRCIAGFLNGNIGVMKSIIGDITDHTNMAQAFAVIPAIFCIGATIAPLYGGALAKPQDQWPELFSGDFWANYPYFLPCAVSGSFTLFSFFVCMILLKESLPSKTGKKNSHPETPTIENQDDALNVNDTQPIPIKTLMKTYSVMIPIANYGTLALVEIGVLVLLPLFYSAPVEIGGLGFPPSTIGLFLAVFGVVDGLVQALFVAKIINKIGAKNLFCWAVLFYYPLIALFPIMSAVVIAHGKVGLMIWTLLILQLIFMVLMDMSYAVIFIFTTRAAPNKYSLGTMNGLGQTTTSITRAIGPAMTTSLFAFSKEYNILGGNLVYIILAVLTTVLVFLSRRLPELRDDE
ncbi:Drug:H+ antiporter-1 family protein [Paxillus involutus ATCC 200175]|uniref:Drug:H+ antiporter-1 family protein n=1 Tax=Paxillus involutus ATCC 200175 TaxID=664439 RepID=A0A0C9TFC3_PAXIN|nr:Drug:H+ antiporter-1 family protein [Paxillus involutus ATCC 200175]